MPCTTWRLPVYCEGRSQGSINDLYSTLCLCILLLCVVRNQQRGDWNENRTRGVHPASELVWDRKVCVFCFGFGFRFCFALFYQEGRNLTDCVWCFGENQELEFGKSLRQEPMMRFTRRLRFVLVKVVCNRNEEGKCEKLSAAGQMLSHWAQT